MAEAENKIPAGKKAVLAISAILLMLVFGIGLIFSLELGFRLAVSVPAIADLLDKVYPFKQYMVDVELFPYAHYTVSTQPPGLVLGRTNNPIEGFFAAGQCDAEGGVSARFNSNGFRSPEFWAAGDKQSNELRVIITGGSAAISLNVGEACTLDNQLQRALSNQYPGRKITIFNLGSGAWKSFQELIAILEFAPLLHPDVIVVFDGFNDINHSMFAPVMRPYANHAMLAFQRYQDWMRGSPWAMFGEMKLISGLQLLLFGPSRMVRQPQAMVAKEQQWSSGPFAYPPGNLNSELVLPLNREAVAERTDFDPYNREVVEFYLRNQRMIAEAATAMNSAVIFVLQPTLYLKTPLSPEEHSTLIRNYASTVNYTVVAYRRMRDGLTALVRDRKRAVFVDMSQLFDRHPEQIFHDYAHMKMEGYQLVVAGLTPVLTRLLGNTAGQ
ncbi:putative SGNH hydrolase-type esterase domain-containing protein [uncultured Gammaproteobacteria bacterium]